MDRLEKAREAINAMKVAEGLLAQIEEYELAHKVKEARESLEGRRVIGFLRKNAQEE